MDALTFHRFGPGPAVGHSADDWSRETARRMYSERASAGAIIQKLTAYGLSLFTAHALVRELSDH